jgi:hypothetical protein
MEPEASAFALHSGCKEGVEDPVHDIGRHAGTVVGDAHGDLPIRLPKLDPNVLGA